MPSAAKASARITKLRRSCTGSVLMLGFEPGADRPAGLLPQHLAHRRHIDLAVMARAMLVTLDEPFIAAVAQLQIAQVGAMPPLSASRPWQRAQFWP
jgi:ABC-type branched-subunit amino acid transport system ATPase component